MIDKLLFRIEGISRAILCDLIYAILTAASTIGIAIGLANAIVNVWSGIPLEHSVFWIAVFALCFMARAALECISDAHSRSFATTGCSDLRDRYMKGIYTLGANRKDKGSAAVALEAVQGIDNVFTYLTSILPKMVDVVVIPLILCVAIYTQDVASGVIVTVCYPFIMLFMKLIGHTASDEASSRHDGFKRMSGHFADSMRGIFTLRSFGASAGHAKKVRAASESYRKLTMRTLRVAMLSGAILDIFATCGLAAVAIMLGFRMVDAEVAFLPALIVLVLTPEFFRPIRRFASDYHSSLEGRSSLSSIFSVIDDARDEVAASFGRESFEDVSAIDRSIANWGSTSEEDDLHPSERMDPPTLCLKNIEFRYDGTRPILRDVDLEIACGQWVLLTGESGQGKTTLANIIAGLASPTNGEIYLGDAEMLTLARDRWRRRVAYIPQDPYIFNATLRDNLRFYDPNCDDDKILDVASKLGLLGLIDALPDGLDTVIGDGAHGLSGGQLQRIALARAILDDARDVWILDEPTAHLDIETEMELKEQIVASMVGKTVLIISHRMHWMSVADKMVELKDGKLDVIECGASHRDGHESLIDASIKAASDEMSSRCASVLCDEPSFARHQQATSSRAARPKSDTIGFSLIGSSVSKREVVGRVRGFIIEHGKPLAIFLALGLIVNIFASGLMFTSGFMISLAAAMPATVLALHVPSLFVRIFGIGKPCISYVERLSSHDWILRITSDLRSKFFRFMDMRAARSRGKRDSVGDALAFFSQTMEHVQDLLIRGVLPMAVMLLTLVAVVICAAIFSPILALILAVMLSSAVVVMPIIVARKRSMDIAVASKIRAFLLKAANDDVFGVRDWILSGRGSEFVHLDDRDRSQLKDIERDMAAGARVRLVIFDLVMCIVMIVVLVWASIGFTDPSDPLCTDAVRALGAMPMQDASSYPANWIAAFVLCTIPMAEMFFRASDHALVIEEHKASVKAISRIESELEDDPKLLVDMDARVGPRGSGQDAHDIPASGCTDAIRMRDASFCYSEREDDAISLDLTIGAGEHVAVIGRSGAGKSTMAKLISGELSADSGIVESFGVDVRSYGEDIHRMIGVVEQDPYIFDQSIRENLLLAKPSASERELSDAIDKVGLSKMVDAHAGSLDAMIGESGASISGGERTRMALARVLLVDTPIVVLDEPFTGLDPVTEDGITDVMMSAFSDKTLICVTHHLRNIERFDRVIMIDHGRIVADGSPEQLAHGNERFSKLLSFERGALG